MTGLSCAEVRRRIWTSGFDEQSSVRSQMRQDDHGCLRTARWARRSRWIKRFGISTGATSNAGHDGCMRFEDDDDNRAPICPACGVTALPAHWSHVIDSHFVCDNEECEAYGEPV